jgi:hypothetical protein
MGHDTYHVFCVCTQRMRVCAKCACICAFANFLTEYLQICWEHSTTHHKWQGLRTFHVQAPCARVRARVCKSARD